MVFVTMSCYATNNAFAILNQECEVWKYQVDAVHVGIGKHESAVDEQQLVVLLEHHAVATNLAETA
jgi:hypothetical protein